MRSMTSSLCAQSGEAYRSQATALKEQMGQVVLVIDTTFDRQGLQQLKTRVQRG